MVAFMEIVALELEEKERVFVDMFKIAHFVISSRLL